MMLLWAYPGLAQELDRHGEVVRVTDDTLYIEMGSKYRVDPETEGRVFTTTTIGGDEAPIFLARVRVVEAQQGMAYCEVVEQSGTVESGYNVAFFTVRERASRGRLVIRPRPKRATVFIDGERIGQGRVERTVDPGTYQVRVEAEGYEPVEVAMSVRADSTSDATFPLERLPGTLIVRTQPDSAVVFIDDQRVGLAPVRQQVGAGRYQIRAEKDDFDAAEATLTVAANATRDTTLQLSPVTGTLLVQTTPDSVTVFVDDEPVGTTPLRTSIAAGERTIRLVRDGYKSITVTDSVHADRIEMLTQTLEPTLQRGQLVVRSEPDNARVYLDGEPIGQTPLRRDLEVGSYNIRVQKDRYGPAEQTVSVEANATQAVNMSLERLKGALVVTSEPEGAAVYVDGRHLGETPHRATLPTGSYDIRVTKSWYEPAERTVTVSARGEERVGFPLRRPLDVALGQHSDVIDNAQLQREGDQLRIAYDLAGEKEDDKYEIELLLSSDGGATYEPLPETVHGAVGDGVRAGAGKQILWEVLQDFPYGLAEADYRLRIAADKKGSAGWWVFGSFVTLGGGAAAAVLTGLVDVSGLLGSGGGDDDSGGEGDGIPAPPTPPGN